MTPWKRPYDPLEDDTLFGAEEAKSKRESSAEEADRLARMDELASAAEAKRRAEAQAWLLKGNDKMIEDGYRARGLEPPARKEGHPLVSLDVLLSLGWTIEEISGKAVLVRPPKPDLSRYAPAVYEMDPPPPKTKSKRKSK